MSRLESDTVPAPAPSSPVLASITGDVARRPVLAATNAVSMDEPCLGLVEVNLQSPGSKGFRRYQIITVIRNDGKAECWRNLGKAARWKIDQFRILGGVQADNGRFEIVHTVGELYDIATYMREGPWSRIETPEPGDLIQGYYDRPDKLRRARKRLSLFGERVRVQRG